MMSTQFEARPERPEVHLHENINFCFRTNVSPALVISAFRVAYRENGANWGLSRVGDFWQNQFVRLYIVAVPADEYIVALSIVETSDSSQVSRWLVEGNHLQIWQEVQGRIAVGSNEEAQRGPDEVGFGNLSARQVAQYVPVMRGLTADEVAESDTAAIGPLAEPEGPVRGSRKRRWFR